MAEMKNLTINGEQFVLPFAPAGYGLGGASVQQSAATWNGCGFFRFENGTPDNKTVMGYQVDLWGDGSIRELYGVCVSDTYKSRLHRTDFNGVPGEWEWENPPMVLGVEYRTTERHNGKVVYAAAINAGTLPSNTYKDVTLLSSITGLVDLRLLASNLATGNFKAISSNYIADELSMDVAGYNRIRIYSMSKDSSSMTGEIRIKYTKD